MTDPRLTEQDLTLTLIIIIIITAILQTLSWSSLCKKYTVSFIGIIFHSNDKVSFITSIKVSV